MGGSIIYIAWAFKNFGVDSLADKAKTNLNIFLFFLAALTFLRLVVVLAQALVSILTLQKRDAFGVTEILVEFPEKKREVVPGPDSQSGAGASIGRTNLIDLRAPPVAEAQS